MTVDASEGLSRRERADRSRSRAWALQVLYRWEAAGGDTDLLDALQEVERTRYVAPRRRPWLESLVRAIRSHREELDEALTSVTRNWRLDRLSRIDRGILRIGAAELLVLPGVPPRVAIQEAVRLAERYGGNDSARFVNGVLDALYHARRPEA